MNRYLLALFFFVSLALCSIVQAGTGSIQGTVNDPSGNPIEGIRVYAYDPVDSDPFSGYEAQGTTNASGVYTINDLNSGTCVYKIKYNTAGYLTGYGIDYIEQWYNNKPDHAAADCVDVIDGETTELGSNQLVLNTSPLGSISGTVTELPGETALEGAKVNVYNSADQWIDSTITASNGTYTLPNLETGSYTVQFIAIGYIYQWYNKKSSQGNATPVPVTAPDEKTTINAALSVGSTLSGKITAHCSEEAIAG
ncbi:MAG: carboxypeptidase regulatory-like domain-containing protein, partial [Candidatus Electrothrix sp. AR3]|nr:carboxypeptidase regulatory-like domain-containing protein [Candidatus Electrothrix sp. AR3]